MANEKLRVIQTDKNVTTDTTRWTSVGNDAIIFDKAAGGVYIGNGSKNPTLIATKVTDSKITELANTAITNRMGPYTINHLITFNTNSPDYVAARFADTSLSVKAADTYIEFWGSGGWYNSKWGTVTATNKFVGNLEGTAENSSKLGNLDASAYMPLAGGDVSSTNFRLIHKGSNYTEGIRLAHKDSSVGKWSGIHFGCDPSAATGTHSKQWTVARNANNNFVVMNYETDVFTIDTSKNATFYGKLNVSNALCAITRNSNTLTLGNQDANFCHLYNSANIPFKFNNAIVPSASATYNLGSDTLKWKNIYASGDTYSGAYYTSSDERLKTFGDNIEVDLDKLSKLRKSYFTFNSDESSKTHIGVSAQEIKEIYPEIVNTNDDGYLSVDYAKLSVIALKAVDNLHERLTRLEKLLLDKE